MTRALHSRPIGSLLAITLISLASGGWVLAIAILMQWLIYDDWLHQAGPLQIFGSLFAAALTSFVVLGWQIAVRRRRQELIRRFESIARMNDRIRNSLQTIDLLAFLNSQAAEQVHSAVEAISGVLSEVLQENRPEQAGSPVGRLERREPVDAPGSSHV